MPCMLNFSRKTAVEQVKRNRHTVYPTSCQIWALTCASVQPETKSHKIRFRPRQTASSTAKQETCCGAPSTKIETMNRTQPSLAIPKKSTHRILFAWNRSSKGAGALQKLRKTAWARNGLAVVLDWNGNVKNKNLEAIPHHFTFNPIDYAVLHINRHPLSCKRTISSICKWARKHKNCLCGWPLRLSRRSSIQFQSHFMVS